MLDPSRRTSGDTVEDEFELSDLVVENGTATALTGSGEQYEATVEVADEFEGERTITVPFGVAQDADGRVNNAGSCTRFIDKRPPRVAITGPADGGPVHGPFAVRIVFDEPVFGVQLADLTVGNGTASGLRAVEASRGEGPDRYAEYVATITPAGSGTVTVDLAAGQANDSQRNLNLAAAQYSIEMVAPEVVLSLSHSELSEGSGATEVTVTATVESGTLVEDLPVTVTVSGSGDSGLVGFASVPDFTLTLPARQTEATATFTLTPADDATAAADETVTVGGTASLPWIAVEAATLGLLDNDEVSTALLLTATPGTIAEGAGATEVTVTATLDGAARTAETEVTVTVSGPDATRVEFAAVEPFTLTIAANAASGSASFTLTPADDAWGPPRHRRLAHRRRHRARLGPRHRPPHRRRRGIDPRRADPVGGRGGGGRRRHDGDGDREAERGAARGADGSRDLGGGGHGRGGGLRRRPGLHPYLPRRRHLGRGHVHAGPGRRRPRRDG